MNEILGYLLAAVPGIVAAGVAYVKAHFAGKWTAGDLAVVDAVAADVVSHVKTVTVPAANSIAKQ